MRVAREMQTAEDIIPHSRLTPYSDLSYTSRDAILLHNSFRADQRRFDFYIKAETL